MSSVMSLLATIRVGDKVTILVPNGLGRNGVEWTEKTGRAVMPGPATSTSDWPPAITRASPERCASNSTARAKLRGLR